MVSFQSISPPDGRLWFSSEGLRLGKVLLDGALEKGPADERFDRLDLKLAVVFRGKLPKEVVGAIDQARAFARAGDLALANIRLAQTVRLGAPEDDDLAERLALTDDLLQRGVAPQLLRLELGYEPTDLAKYPGQPRNPAGSGIISGRWVKLGEEAMAAATAVLEQLGPKAIFLPLALSPAAATIAAAAVVTIGFGVAAGLLVVPSSNETSEGGPLPDDSGLTYDFDHDTGLLRIRDAEGVLLAGHADAHGIFRDVDTGVAFGRLIAGHLVMDAAAIDAADDSSNDAAALPRVDAEALADPQKPRLCPRPDPDNPGFETASKQAKEYQAQIDQMVNPLDPVPPGYAYALVNPSTGKLVHYDTCHLDTGGMVEAKGDRHAYLLTHNDFIAGRVMEGLLRQARLQIAAGGSRPIDWCFSESVAADIVAEKFSTTEGIRDRITVHHVPRIP